MCVFVSRRRATRSTMVLVIIPPAGSLKLPPRPLACCANAEAQAASTSRIKNPPPQIRELFLFIIDRFFRLPTVIVSEDCLEMFVLVAYAGK